MTLKQVSATESIISYAQGSAKFYALKLINDGHYSFYEVDDLEQELLALFLYQIKKYPHDSNKSSEKHWISIIMENIYKNLRSKSIRNNRYISKISLNDSIGTSISSSSRRFCCGSNSTNNSKGNNSCNNDQSNESEIIDFIQDDKFNTFEIYCKQKTEDKIMKTIETMPNDLKDICRYLQSDNVSDIAKKLNISRKTIYQKIHKIKSIFEKSGIDEDWEL